MLTRAELDALEVATLTDAAKVGATHQGNVRRLLAEIIDLRIALREAAISPHGDNDELLCALCGGIGMADRDAHEPDCDYLKLVD